MNHREISKHKTPPSSSVIGVIAAVFAAVCGALYAPLTKLIPDDAGILMSLAFIFFGVGAGMLVVLFFGRKSKAVFDSERHLRKKDTVKVLLFVALSLFMNLFLLLGFQQESAAVGSILQNLIPVSTVLFAVILLREKISKRFGVGAALIILGGIALTIPNVTAFSLSTGALLIITGCICGGLAFTVMKLLAERNPVELNIIRGFSVGIILFIAAFCMGESLPSIPDALALMGVGFLGCGLSTLLLMYSQRYLGSAKSGIIFGIYPLLGVLFSIPILGEMPAFTLLAALILIIPGMYFIILKKPGTDGAAAKDKRTDESNPSDKEDTTFFVSISENKKFGMRNSITCLGLLSVALFFAAVMLNAFDMGNTDAALMASSFSLLCLILGIVVLLCGIALLFLGKRVPAAVTFILMSSQILATALLGENLILSVLSGVFSLLFACVLMTSKDPQRYAFALVSVLLGVASVSSVFHHIICGCIMAVSAGYLLWLAIVCGTGRLRYFIAKPLTEDSDVTFGRCGAVIGFLMFSKLMVTPLIYEFNPLLFAGIPGETLLTLMLGSSLLVILLGLLLMFVGKRQMTAVFFIAAGVLISLDMFSAGLLPYLSAFLSLVLGILVVLRSRTLILPAVIPAGCAFSTLLYYQMPAFPEIAIVLYLINAVVVVIDLYLTFAVFSEKPKLPIF